jgi:hypothetical protein
MARLKKVFLKGLLSWRAVFVALVTIATFVVSLPASASSLGPNNSQRKVLASTEAHHLLKLATLPKGSVRLAHWIAADGTALLSAPGTPTNPDQVDLTEFFLAPGGNRALNWLKAQVPKGGHTASSGSSSGPGTDDEEFLGFSFHGTTVLPNPALQYSMLITPKGQLGFRVDAMVAWTPQKSPYSIVPPGATEIAVTVNRGLNVTTNKITTVDVTDPLTISEFLAKVNELPVQLPGVEMCPNDVGSSMTLQFFLSGASTPYATVVADPAGCGAVTIKQFGANDALIGTAGDSGGGGLAKYIATVLGITNWSGMDSLTVNPNQ